MKTIYLMRHAKSSWSSDASSDFERPLSRRGYADAARMGREMKRRGWIPQAIIASPAKRAQQTCELVCENAGLSHHDIQWNRDVYAAYTVTLLHILSNQDESVDSILMIGHNPAMEDLLVHLCGIEETHAYLQENGKLFTTANIARIRADVSWKNLVMHDAKLLDLVRPKEID